MSELKGVPLALDLMQYILDNTDDGYAQDNLPDAMEALRTTEPREDVRKKVDPLGQLWTILYGMTEQAEPDHEWLFETAKEALDLLESYTATHAKPVVWCRCGDGIEDPKCKTCYLTDTDDGLGDAWELWREVTNHTETKSERIKDDVTDDREVAEGWTAMETMPGARHYTVPLYRHPQSGEPEHPGYSWTKWMLVVHKDGADSVFTKHDIHNTEAGALRAREGPDDVVVPLMIPTTAPIGKGGS